MNPFLARFSTFPGALSWFDVYDGKGQSQLTKSFYVTALQDEVVLVGNWITHFSFTEDASKVLSAKGNGIDDENIIAAKITPKP
ncbi:hypothetical protein [Polyangium sorediatum]|uniref:Uncharacterized protein n=1 Tax=Polyangium sorediatum TaxID=889274 RepID=A0ABT6P2E4_9BACT|nr:hypothetical protein [Polyangium sorediatum]MDI1434775.1 hypothetical protein [Polyangium sorediatum]